MAQKQLLKPDQWGVEEFEEAAKREADNLQRMNEYENADGQSRGHLHFIKGIAYYTQNEGHFFIFPWAEHGNLDMYWHKHDHTLTSTHLWAFKQMAGLASGLQVLHQHNHRHGDLKPANILCFTNRESTDGLRLVIADVGLAKVHNELTQFRKGATKTNAASVTYMPPEFEVNLLRGRPTSRLYDVWSMGCLFLEFVIWLLGGIDELMAFRAGLRDKERDAPVPFWGHDRQEGRLTGHSRGASSQQLRVHPWVRMSLDLLLDTLEPDAPLHTLVKLIETRLLVVEIQPSQRQLPTLDANENLVTPSIQLIPATTNFNDDDEATVLTDYRADADEFAKKMSDILKGLDTTTYKVKRIDSNLPSTTNFAVENASRGLSAGRQTLHTGIPLVRISAFPSSHQTTYRQEVQMCVLTSNFT